MPRLTTTGADLTSVRAFLEFPKHIDQEAPFAFLQTAVNILNKIQPMGAPNRLSVVTFPTRVLSARNRRTKYARRLIHMIAACILAATMIGCGTTHVVDRKYRAAAKYSQSEALDILKTALLKGAITDLELNPAGFSYKLALTRFGGATPFTKTTITFAEITKVKSVRGPRGDFFYLYKEVGGQEEECFQGLSGRDDAFADQVAAALFVLCPNLK